MRHFLDITKDHCPMTFVKVKLKLQQLKEGEELEVLLMEGEPLTNVPKTVEEQGSKVLGIEPKGDKQYQILIQK